MERGFRLLVLSTLLLTAPLQAQEPPQYGWKNEIISNLGLNQVGFDNWAQGGENAFSWQFDLNAKFIKTAEKTTWTTTGKFAYGQSRVGDQGTRKTVDEVRLESVLKFNIEKAAEPYLSMAAWTQFADGLVYGDNGSTVVSTFFDPLYMTQSAGIGFEPTDGLKIRIGASAKQTFTSSYPTYADNPDTPEIEKTLSEFGAESVIDLTRKFSEDLILKSKMELFSNISGIDEVDVNWDTQLTAKVAKYISVNLGLRLLYDKNISKKRQLMQTMAIGFTYSFL